MSDWPSERLTKLLLLLSSSQPGEVVAAARAVTRLLQDSNSDWHDLVARLSTPAQLTRRNGVGRNWQAMREFCLRHPSLLRSRELEFITGLGDWRGDLTEKQFAWLSAIHERLRRRHAA